MTTSPAGRKLIEQFEGLSLKAYADQRGIPTIGYGHTLGVKLGDTCTPEQADEWLAGDLDAAEKAVDRLVKCALTQNQFDALVSLVFNIGQGDPNNPKSGGFANSTVREKLNEGMPEYSGAADAFLLWDKTNGQTNQGLLNRRTAEKALFLTPVV